LTALTVDGKSVAATDYLRQYTFKTDVSRATDDPIDKNPTFSRADSDRLYFDIGAKATAFTARVQVRTFDANGQITDQTSSAVIDFSDPNAKPVLVDTRIDASSRTATEIYIDPKSREVVEKQIKMVQQNGRWEKQEVGTPRKTAFDPAQLKVSTETSIDNPESYMPFVDAALDSARNYVSETADGDGVWNGETQSMRMGVDWLSPNKTWALVHININAQYGDNNGAFLVKLNPDGTRNSYVPVRMPFDFAWRTDSSFDPASGRETEALERGMITRNGSRVDTTAVGNMLKRLWAAFHAMPYTAIAPDGKMYGFADRAAWQTAKTEWDRLRSAALDGAGGGGNPGGGGGGGTTIATLLEINNSTAKLNTYRQHTVQAAADGDLTVAIRPHAGHDADLYVKVGAGGAMEGGAGVKVSDKSGSVPDEITLKGVKKGETVSIGVYGYQKSDRDTEVYYDLTVTGPKESTGGGGTPTPTPAIDLSFRAGLDKDKTQLCDAIYCDKATTLDVRLLGDAAQGSDMDLYWQITSGRSDTAPTLQKFTGRFWGDGSTENGIVQVPANSSIRFMFHSYGAHSEATLKVKSV
jgi:hypothetical protein